uniref:Uncharacterized protein n=1 Tax=Romanomermis culicivorax TaxID=13658 RepID=A0A915J143_ROMCU
MKFALIVPLTSLMTFKAIRTGLPIIIDIDDTPISDRRDLNFRNRSIYTYPPNPNSKSNKIVIQFDPGNKYPITRKKRSLKTPRTDSRSGSRGTHAFEHPTHGAATDGRRFASDMFDRVVPGGQTRFSRHGTFAVTAEKRDESKIFDLAPN